ncbi:MAG: hypothetical protein ATN31_01705 [Candidatus Epulonipiscioides saccharophilum]|nr:MAG: hypothetical protein ATN31_01705 [Epulopiscium sp. AS2M-Bin001]
MKFWDTKLTKKISILFISIFLLTLFAVNTLNSRTVHSLSEIYITETLQNYENELNVFYSINKLVENNSSIKELLTFINNDISISDQQISQYTNEVESICNLLHQIGIKATISIYTLNENVLFNNSYIDIGSSIFNAPWFNISFFDFIKVNTSPNKTPPYFDPKSNESMFSIVSIIQDLDQSLLGATSINIPMGEVLNYFKQDFAIGDVDLYLEHTLGMSTTVIPTPTSIPLKSSDKLLFTFENLPPNPEILTFVVDKSSVEESSALQKNLTQINIGILLYAIIVYFLIVIIIRKILIPVLSSMEKFQTILIDLGYEGGYNFDISNISDLAEIIEYNISAKIRELLLFDNVTKLPNRQYFDSYITKLITNQTEFSLIVIEIRNFKSLSDGKFKGNGDVILFEVSKLLKSMINQEKIHITRFSDNKFILTLIGHYNSEELDIFYSKILNFFKLHPISVKNKTIKILFNSSGIIFSEHSHSKDDLFNKINVMSINAKKLANNNLVIFNTDLYQNYLKEEIIRDILAISIANNEFFLNYQPIINSKKQIQKSEALIRWKNSFLGFVSPDQFIYITEQTELIIDLGYWIIEKVATDLKELYDQNMNLQISINVSPIQLRVPDFVIQVINIFEKYSINYNDICFEVTESVLMHNEETEVSDTITDNLYKLQYLGIRIAMDDFGTGYSSFKYLNEFHFDILKLDKLFVNKTTDKQYEIINSIKNISDILGMEMIIEGVETQEQFDIVKNYGLIQGYYFSKPILWEDLKTLLIKYNSN